MPRQASDLTKAMWKLFEKNADISHAQAQPLLAKQGFEVVTKPEMSDDLKLWRETGKELGLEQKGDYIGCAIKDDEYEYDKTAYEKIRQAAGLSTSRANQVLQEIMLRVAFDAEANAYNVTKYNWKKSKPSSSRKPAAKQKQTVAKSNGSAPPPKHGRKLPKSKKGKGKTSKVVVEVDGDFSPTTALEYVESNGGLNQLKRRVKEIAKEVADSQAETKAKIAELEAETKAKIAELQAEMEAKTVELEAEQERHNEALNTLANFQKAMKEAA